MSDAKWIKFILSGSSESGKTKIWRVINKDNDQILGRIKWFARWRKYSFFPLTGTVYEKDCLRDIADFSEEETRKHKSHRGN